MNDPASPQGQAIAESRRLRAQQQQDYEQYSAEVSAERKAYEEVKADYYSSLRKENSDLGWNFSEEALRFIAAAQPAIETAEDSQYMKERLAAADMYSDLFNVSLENAFLNLDNFHQQWMGDKFVKKTGWKAVADSVRLSFVSREYNKLAQQLAKQGGTDPDLLQAVQDYEQRIDQLKDHAPRWWQDDYVKMGGWDDVGQLLRSATTSLAENAVPIAEGMGWAALAATGVGALGASAGLSATAAKILVAGASRLAIAGSTYNSTWGIKYREMTNQGIPHDIAKNYAQVDSLIEGLIEGSLGGVEAAGAQAITKTIVPQAISKATTRFFISGKMGIGAKAILNWLKEGVEEGSEEVLQGISSGGMFNAAAKKANEQREAYREEKLREIAEAPFEEARKQLESDLEKYLEEHPEVNYQKWKDILDEAIEGGIAGFATGIILGIPIEITNYRSNVRSAMQLAEMAQAAPNEAVFKEWVGKAKEQGFQMPMAEEMKSDEEADILSDLYKVQQERLTPEQRAEKQKQAQDMAALSEVTDYSDDEIIERIDAETGETITELSVSETNDIYKENGKFHIAESTEINEDSSIKGRFIAADPRIQDDNQSKIQWYGNIDYTENDNDVTINKFFMKSRFENQRQQFFDQFAEKFAGKNIIWNPQNEQNIALRDQLVNQNQRGHKEGLNYYENKSQIKVSNEARQVAARFTPYLKNSTPLETALAAELFNNFYRHRGESLNGAMSRLLGKVTNEAPAAVRAAQREGVKVKGATWFDETAESMRHIVYLNKNAADISTVIHETSHIVAKDFTDAERNIAGRALNGYQLKNGTTVYFEEDGGQWTDEQHEAFAEALENYLTNGTAPDNQLKSLFERIKDFMKRIYQTMRGWTELSPKVEEFYQSFLSGELVDQARAETDNQTNEESHSEAQQQNTEMTAVDKEITQQREAIINSPDIPLEEKAQVVIDEAGDALYQLDKEGNGQLISVYEQYHNEDGTAKEGWLKAPNGNDTNLTERQWLAVRTKAFKEWFGDWEALAKAEIYQKGIGYTEAQNKLLSLLETEKPFLLNSKTGEKVRLSKSSIGKLISNEAVRKSIQNGFSREQHYAAASDIDHLFFNAEKLFERPDKNNDVNVTIHRYAAPLHFGDNVALITVKESIQHGKRMYSAELMEITKLEGILKEAENTAHFPSSSLAYNNIIQSAEAVKSNSVSKIIDQNGEPLVVYHGTSAAFEVFDLEKAGTRRDDGMLGKGFYFSTDKQAAGIGDTRLIEAFINARSPLNLKMESWLQDKTMTVSKALEIIEGNLTSEEIRNNILYENDAVVLDYSPLEYHQKELLVMNPEQIKSATNNVGTYDPRNPSILFQIEQYKHRITYSLDLDELKERYPTLGKIQEGGVLWHGYLNRTYRPGEHKQEHSGFFTSPDIDVAVQFADSGLSLIKVSPGNILQFPDDLHKSFDLFGEDKEGNPVEELLDFLRSAGVNIPTELKMDYEYWGQNNKYYDANLIHLVEHYLAPYIWQKYDSILWESNGGQALVLKNEDQAMLLEFFSPAEATSDPKYNNPLFQLSDEQKETVEAAKEVYGTTTDFREAGYLLTDGTMLDLSGKKDGGEPGHRYLDHREMNYFEHKGKVYKPGMDGFMSMGNIRLKPEMGGIELTKSPNNKQAGTLRNYIKHNNGDVIIDFSKENLNVENSIEYSGAHPDRVLNDIKNYYEKGELPPEVPVLFQTAWNASVAMFDRFDNYYAGRSGFTKTHGWGHSFYSQREAADWYSKKLEEYKGAYGWLYEAKIPDDTELLDWEKPLYSQPEAVKNTAVQLITWNKDGKSNFNEAYNLRKFKDGKYGFFRSINGKMKWATIEEAQVAAKSEIMKTLDGKGFYSGIAKTIGEKNTSLLLDSMGIKGIKYLDKTTEKMGLQASHSYTVFGDQAIAMTPLLFQTEDRNMIEEAASFDSWQEWKAYCEAEFYNNPMGEHELEIEPWATKEEISAWYKSFWENSKKAKQAVNSKEQTEETPAGERATPAELDREFIEEIKGEGALEKFVEKVTVMHNEDYKNYGAITEEDAAERDRQAEISDNLRRKLKHPTWKYVFMAQGKMTQKQHGDLLTMIKHSPRDYRAIYAEVMEREDLAVSAEDRTAEILKHKITTNPRTDVDIDSLTPEKLRQLSEKIAIEDYSKLVDTGRAKFNEPIEKAYIKQLKGQRQEAEEQLKEGEADRQEDNLYIERQAGTEFLKTFERAVKASAFITINNEKLAKAIKTGEKDAARIARQLQRANSNYDSIVKTLEALKDAHKLEIDIQEALANEKIKEYAKSAKTQSTLQKHLAVKAAREKWTARLAELKEQQQAAKEVTKAKVGVVKRISRKADAHQVDAGHGMKMAVIQRFAAPSLEKGVNEFMGEIEQKELRPVFEIWKIDERLRADLLKDKPKETKKKMTKLFNKAKFEDLTADEKKYLSRKIAPVDWYDELDLKEINERREMNYPIGEAERQIAQQILPPDVYYRIMDKPFSQWTLNEAEELAKIIDDLYVEGKQLYKANIDAERRRIREYQNAVRSTIRTVIKKGVVLTDKDEVEKILGKYKEGTKFKGPLFNYADMNVYRFARMLDNGDTNGKNMAALYRGAKDAHNQELAAMNLRAKKVFDVMKKGKITEKDLWEKAFEIDLGGDLGIKAYTAAEVMGFIYASQNDYSRHAIFGGNLLSESERVEYMIDGITPEETTPLKLLAGDRFAKVTEAAQKFMAENPSFQKLMEVIGEDFAMSGERVGDYLIRYNNNVMRKEKNYFPIIRMQAVSANTADAELASELMGSSSGAFNVFVEKGFTKERNEIPIQYQTKIKLDMFGVWTEAMERQEHFISHGQLVKDLNQIYKNSRPVRDAVQRRYGQAAVKYIDKYINELANPNPDQIRSDMDKFVRTMRGNTAAAYLGWKTSGILKQFITSPAPFFAYMNPIEYYAAQVEYAAKHTELWNEIIELSPYMGSRSSSLMIDLVKEQAKHRSDNKAVNAINDFNKLGMKGLEIVDRVCVAPGWLVLFRKEQKRLTEGNTNGTMSEKDIRVKAAQYADDIVGLTQPSSWHADLPQLFKGNNEFAKAFLQFTQSLSMIWQNIRYDMPQMIRDRRFKNAAGTIIGYTIAGIMLGAITSWFDDDDDTPEKKAKRIAWWATTQFTDAFPIIGSEVTRLTEQAFTGKKRYQGGARNLLPVLEKIYNMGSTGITAIQEKDFDKGLKTALNAIEAVEIFYGLPSSGIKELGALTGIGDRDGKLDFNPEALLGRR